MKKELEQALFEAFLEAGEKLGARIKGLSCFLQNWKHASTEQKQAA
jgi:hypothetical protein